MAPPDATPPPGDTLQRDPSIQCDACESALSSNADRDLSFLLLDQLTVPVIGCENHRERFSAVCGLTTDGSPELLAHRPAGGIRCPSCHLAPHNPNQPVIPVEDGAVAVLACARHQAAIIDRFRNGLDTQQQLTASLDL